MKSFLKQLSFGILCVFVFNLFGAADAFAQSFTTHTMKKIRKSLERAEIVVPNDVMARLDDLQVQSAELDRLEKTRNSKHMSVFMEDFLNQDPDFDSNNQKQADFVLNYQKLENDYYKTDAYRAYVTEKDALRAESIDLLSPYIAEPEPLRPDSSKMTEAEAIEFRRRIYVEVSKLSAADLQQVEKIDQEQSILNKNFLPLWRAPNSPEFEKLMSDRKALSRKKRAILRPYEKRLMTKQRARTNIRNLLGRKVKRVLTDDEKAVERIDRLEKKYADNGIEFSDRDRGAMKSLFQKMEALKEEAVQDRRLRRKGDSLSIEQANLKSRYERLDTRAKAILEPYDKRLEAATNGK